MNSFCTRFITVSPVTPGWSVTFSAVVGLVEHHTRCLEATTRGHMLRPWTLSMVYEREHQFEFAMDAAKANVAHV